MSFLRWRRGRGTSPVPELGVKLQGLLGTVPCVPHGAPAKRATAHHPPGSETSPPSCLSIGRGHVASGLPIPALPHTHFVTLDPCHLFLSLSFVFYKMNMIPVW